MFDEITVESLLQPLIKGLGEEHREKALEMIGRDREGVLAWAVRSGYLLWSRQNPGAIPTREQIMLWIVK